MKKTVELTQLVPQEIHERTVDELIGVCVLMDESTGVVKIIPQDEVGNRTVQQILGHARFAASRSNRRVLEDCPSRVCAAARRPSDNAEPSSSGDSTGQGPERA